MRIHDKEYKKQLTQIGGCLLLFLGISLAVSILIVVAEELCYQFLIYKYATVVYELIYSLGYALMFLIPMFFYKKLDKGYSFSSMPCEFKVSSKLPLLILAGLAINLIAAYLNALAVFMIGFDITELIEESYPQGYQGYHFILNVIKMAIIPAVVEELLFRGLILDRLSRFGREKAILISALLFALMHQNPAQFFYTFILGLFLGYMFYESGSILGCIILHFVNNFYQVIADAITYTQPEARANLIVSIIQLVILLAGSVCAITYFVRHGRKKLFDEEWLFCAQKELSAGYSVKGFFNPTIIIYCVLTLISAISLMFMV